MENSVLICGSGGQGVMLIGSILSTSAIASDCNASCMPSYGPEMRGGTANCTVVYSDDEIITPLIERVSAMILLNQPSMDKFFNYRGNENCRRIINSSLVRKTYGVSNVCEVPCNDLAMEIGNPKGINMVALGAYIGAVQCITLDVVAQQMEQHFPGKEKIIKLNKVALQAGYDYVRNTTMARG